MPQEEDVKATDDKVDKTVTQTDKSEENQDADPKDTENMIPQSRMNKVVSERNDLRKRIADIETKQAEADKKALEEKGEFKELAEKLQKEKEELITKNLNANKKMAVLAKLSTPGLEAKDTNLIIRLIDFNGIEISDTGEVSGIDEQIEKLKKNSAYLFGTGTKEDTDEDNTIIKKPGEIDWAQLAKTLPREDYRKKYFEAFGMYPPPV